MTKTECPACSGHGVVPGDPLGMLAKRCVVCRGTGRTVRRPSLERWLVSWFAIIVLAFVAVASFAVLAVRYAHAS